MSTFDDFMIGQAVKNDEERDKLRSRALRAEAREKELREALCWALGMIRRPTLVRGQNDEHCAKYAEAERLLSGEPETKEG
jgi:hypothetical protein